MKKAYLDIETDYTGPYLAGDQRLFRDYRHHTITILGLRIVDQDSDRLVQWVGDDVSKARLLDVLEGTECLVTYNGRSIPDERGRTGFDLPVIAAQLGVELDRMFPHTDLVLLCWRRGLYGGLKKVEKTLGLTRTLPGKDGEWAMKTWRTYSESKDKALLDQLLLYNREDVTMLEKVEVALRNQRA